MQLNMKTMLVRETGVVPIDFLDQNLSKIGGHSSLRAKNWRNYSILVKKSMYCFLGAEITESYKSLPRMALGPGEGRGGAGGAPRDTKNPMVTPWGHLGSSFVDSSLRKGLSWSPMQKIGNPSDSFDVYKATYIYDHSPNILLDKQSPIYPHS